MKTPSEKDIQWYFQVCKALPYRLKDEKTGNVYECSDNQKARVKAVYLLAMNVPIERIAAFIGKPKRWVDAVNKEGMRTDNFMRFMISYRDGRKDNKKRPTIVTFEHAQFIAELIQKSPLEKWTGPKVAQLVSERFGAGKIGQRRGLEILAEAKKIIRRSGV
jgi:hypothetical protein